MLLAGDGDPSPADERSAIAYAEGDGVAGPGVAGLGGEGGIGNGDPPTAW